MKRAVLCVPNPQDYINQLDNYSIMIVDVNASPSRREYLLNRADWSLLVTPEGEQHRDGGDYKDERVLMYTSGTTGDSKFYGYSQAQLDMLTNTMCASYDITDNDRYVSVMSMAHAHGQMFYWAARQAGCEINFLPLSEIRQLPKFSPTLITAIPGVLKIVGQLEFDSLRFIRSASAALPDALFLHLIEKFQIPVIEAFGMTEAISHCFTNPLHGEQRMGTIGLPDGIEAKIVNQCLMIKGPTVCTPDWLDTGDLAEQDEKGYYRILGRHVDQININGYKINPMSIERQLLERFPTMQECAVFGRDFVKCLYVGDCTPDEVQAFLISVNPHCRARVLEQIDTLPLNPPGKVSRTWLDARY